MIRATVNGDIDVDRTLGYPTCCVRNERESGLRLRERAIGKLKQAYRPQTVQECLKLLERDAPVRMEPADLAIGQHDESTRLFPYVQFEACADCMKSSDSPAARVNRTMRDLAFSLSPSFGRHIWQAQYEEIQPGLAKTIAGTASCPCGSDRQYKGCCLIIQSE